MAIQKPTKPTDLMPRTFGGVKNNFSDDLQSSGFEANVPQIYNGDNLNYQLDATGKELDYCEKVVDFINSLPVNKVLYVNSNNQLDYVDKDDLGFARNLGEYVWSSVPLTDAWLHLPDGAVLSGSGIYAQFVNHIASLYSEYPSLFVSESDWQASVSRYGVCGKYVYNASANTVRLPKVTGFVEGTLDANALGDLVGAGLPNITGYVSNNKGEYETVSGAFALGDNKNIYSANGTGSQVRDINFDASLSNPIYSNSDTVQPQSILGYMYIVVATATKTEIQVDIDNIATDLNNKVDVSNMVEISEASSSITTMVMPDYTAGIAIGGSSNYIAPANGFVSYAPINNTSTANAVSHAVEGRIAINGYTVLTSAHQNGHDTAHPSSGFFLVGKGETIYHTMTAGTVYFYPCKGVN